MVEDTAGDGKRIASVENPRQDQTEAEMIDPALSEEEEEEHEDPNDDDTVDEDPEEDDDHVDPPGRQKKSGRKKKSGAPGCVFADGFGFLLEDLLCSSKLLSSLLLPKRKLAKTGILTRLCLV